MANLLSDTVETNYITPAGSGLGSIIQTVVMEDTTQRLQAVTNGINLITGLSATINRSRANNALAIYVRWCGEIDNMFNAAFSLRRTCSGSATVDFLPSGYGTAQTAGIAVGMDTYSTSAADNASTPGQCNFMYFDTSPPTTNATVTYQLWIWQRQSVNLATNRTITNSNTGAYEVMSSSIIIQEVSL